MLGARALRVPVLGAGVLRAGVFRVGVFRVGALGIDRFIGSCRSTLRSGSPTAPRPPPPSRAGWSATRRWPGSPGPPPPSAPTPGWAAGDRKSGAKADRGAAGGEEA